MELPLDGRGVRAPSPQASQAAVARGLKVLVIEDNVDAAGSLSEVLELLGHRVAVAYDGKAGVEKAREFRPEVVMCDIGLPAEMDGYAVARALRSDPANATAFLVALTGYALPEDQRRALEAGFDLHLAKPPSLDQIEKVLADYAGRSAMT